MMEINKSDKWGRFIVTDEQAALIAAGDNEARDKFYFENLPRLRAMACNYRKKYHISFINEPCTVEDMMQNLYIDLPLLVWDNWRNLVWSIRSYSFRNSKFGGYWYIITENRKKLGKTYRFLECSYDSKSFNHKSKEFENVTFLDLIDGGHQTLEEKYFCKDWYENLALVDLILRRFLSGKQYEYFSLRILGYSEAKASELLNYPIYRTTVIQCLTRLKVNYKAIVNFLVKSGVEAAISYIDSIPNNYESIRNNSYLGEVPYWRTLTKEEQIQYRKTRNKEKCKNYRERKKQRLAKESAARGAVARSGLACN